MDFAKRVLSWYSQNKRDLPWRKTDDPYKILVSEIMLQQTQVDRVIPKYLAFLKRFPDVQALASAPTSDVLRLWSGLGYNSRAIRLQQAAQIVAQRGWPDSLEVLPGIGPYTAAAVQSFAFHQDVPVIDTNIRRIYSRHYFNGKGTVEQIDAKAVELVPKNKGTDWGNALMDFGSLVCTASSPSCASCPVRGSCTALKSGNHERYLKISAPQKKFEGSRRQYRGKVLKLLSSQDAVTLAALEKHLAKSKTFVAGLIAELEKDGLVAQKAGKVRLP
jgi:A/G-specific adenine glycosylase